MGYNAHLAVDAKNGMIVHQKVVKEQADSKQSVPMVEESEKIKSELMPEKQEESKYILDSGYASEANLEELRDRDIYMPDREYAAQENRDPLHCECVRS